MTMNIPNEFQRKLAERAEAVRAQNHADQEKLRQVAKGRQEKLEEIAAREEEWFPKAQKWRDDEFDEMLETAREQLKAGGIRHRDGDRAFWSQLVSDHFEIALGIIPVPSRGI